MPRAINGMKVCSKCGNCKNTSEYYRKSSTKDGLRNECKACKRIIANRLRQINVNKNKTLGFIELSQATPFKKCTACGIEKHTSNFRINRHNKHGFHLQCKQCESALRDNELKTPVGRARELLSDHKRKGHTLTVRFLSEKIAAGMCELTGLPLELNERGGPWVPSIDQIIPSGGYRPDNCRVVCWGVNAMISTWGIDPVLQVADAYRAKKSRESEVYEYTPIGV